MFITWLALPPKVCKILKRREQHLGLFSKVVARESSMAQSLALVYQEPLAPCVGTTASLDMGNTPHQAMAFEPWKVGEGELREPSWHP